MTSIAVRVGLLALCVAWSVALARADDALFIPVEDSFTIAGMGVAATGKVARGSVSIGDNVEIVGGSETVSATVVAIQIGPASADGAQAGDDVALILRGVDQDQVGRGRVVAAPGVVKAHIRFTADVTMTQANGGSQPIEDGFRPLLRIWTQSVSGVFHLGSGQMVPGAKTRVPIELEEPCALAVGDTFDISQGGESLGSGVVVSIQK